MTLEFPRQHMRRGFARLRRTVILPCRIVHLGGPHLRMKRTFSATATMLRSIELTPLEERLRALLVDAASHLSKANPTIKPLVLRWAGGWVRDKLLGGESHDIDTSINSMTGVDFTTGLLEFCRREDMAKKHNISKQDVGHLATIQRNPEKSKNLETATVRLFGLDCDFVNLRKETYPDDSRNPEMEFGTAQEDAERRDATINALFYNIHSRQVEDLVGGLPDLKAGVIRTPLEPSQTFTDDPLRVLRLVRFATKLQFKIDPMAQAMMGNPQVLDALGHKISRERVGVELEKMLKGSHPVDSLKLIHKVNLYHTIFTDPGQKDTARPDLSHWRTVYECLHDISQNRTPGSIWNVLVRSTDDAYWAWATAALIPWEFVADPKPPQKTKGMPQTARIARAGFTATSKLCNMVTGFHLHRDHIISMKNAVCEKAEHINERDRFGMAIRTWDMNGGCWRVRVLGAILYDVMKEAREPSGMQCKFQVGMLPGNQKDMLNQDQHEATDVVAGWQMFLDHLRKLDVMEAPSLKCPIQGTELANALGLEPGSWMAAALDMCVAWKFRNPGATDVSPAIEEVWRRSDELAIKPKKSRGQRPTPKA